MPRAAGYAARGLFISWRPWPGLGTCPTQRIIRSQAPADWSAPQWRPPSPRRGFVVAASLPRPRSLAARHQRFPVRLGKRIGGERLSEPSMHGVLRPASISGVEVDLDLHPVTHPCLRGLANLAVKVEIKTAVPHGHQVNVPCPYRFAIKSHQNRKRLTLPRPCGLCSTGIDQDERIDASDLDDCLKRDAHCNRRPRTSVRAYAWCPW